MPSGRSPTNNSYDEFSATEAIVGISVGVALVLFVIIVLVICWCKRRSAAAAVHGGTAADGGSNRRGSALFKIQGGNLETSTQDSPTESGVK